MTEERRYGTARHGRRSQGAEGDAQGDHGCVTRPSPPQGAFAGPRNALLDRIGADLIDSIILEITAFKSWFTGAYEGLLDNYSKKQDD